MAIVPWHGLAAMIIRRHLVAFGGTKESSLNHEAVTHKVATRFILMFEHGTETSKFRENMAVAHDELDLERLFCCFCFQRPTLV